MFLECQLYIAFTRFASHASCLPSFCKGSDAFNQESHLGAPSYAAVSFAIVRFGGLGVHLTKWAKISEYPVQILCRCLCHTAILQISCRSRANLRFTMWFLQFQNFSLSLAFVKIKPLQANETHNSSDSPIVNVPDFS